MPGATASASMPARELAAHQGPYSAQDLRQHAANVAGAATGPSAFAPPTRAQTYAASSGVAPPQFGASAPGTGARRAPGAGRDPTSSPARVGRGERAISTGAAARDDAQKLNQELQRLIEDAKNLDSQRQALKKDEKSWMDEVKRVEAVKKKVKQEVDELKQERDKLRAAAGKAPASARGLASGTDASADQSQLQELTKQLQTVEKEAREVEENLREELYKQQKTFEKMKEAKAVLEREGQGMVEKLRDELQQAKKDSSLDANKEEHYVLLQSNLQWSMDKQSTLQSRITAAIQETQRITDAWQQSEFHYKRMSETFKDEEEQWTQEKEMWDLELGKMEKVEQVLKQQQVSLQEKLNAAQKRFEETDLEMRELQGRFSEDQQRMTRGLEERERLQHTQHQSLEEKALSLRTEVAALREEVNMTTAEKKELEVRCGHLETSIQQLEERRRFTQPQGGAASRGRTGAREERGRDASESPAPSAASSASSNRFSTRLKGQNCTVNFVGDTATRTKGCRQCVVLSDQPIEHFPGHGWYFELRINEVVTGWVGGLGIGVSLMSPSQITCLPDRAWRVPRTWIAGYWGRMFANGTQFIIDWKPQDLAVGDTVGFQVTPTGECVVYVNSISKVVFNSLPVPLEGDNTELTACVDVFASASSVTLVDAHPPTMLES